jgi:enoyl-CoA hydratase
VPSYGTLQVSRKGGVAVVRLARPPVNAVNREMMRELQESFLELGVDRSVGAVVLAAEGTRAFCAGIDLREVSSNRDATRDPAGIRDILDDGWYWRETQRLIRHCPVPVIAAVDAPAIGAGFGLVGVADLIIASDRGSFGLTEINVGLLGGASKALRMLGPYKARMMFFSGQLVQAAEFHRLGVVEELVPAGHAEARAIEIGHVFAGKSPIALRLAKESILRIEGQPLEEAYRTEQDYTVRLRQFDDSREAMSAYLEKREPRWAWS